MTSHNTARRTADRIAAEDAAVEATRFADLDAAFEAHNREAAIADGEWDADLNLRTYRVGF